MLLIYMLGQNDVNRNFRYYILVYSCVLKCVFQKEMFRAFQRKDVCVRNATDLLMYFLEPDSFEKHFVRLKFCATMCLGHFHNIGRVVHQYSEDGKEQCSRAAMQLALLCKLTVTVSEFCFGR